MTMRKSAWLRAIALALLCVLLPGAPADAARPKPTLTVATINVGLGPGMVPLANARIGAVAAALAKEPFDVLCVQEAWTPESRAAIRKAFASLPDGQFFHADTAGQNQTGRDWCTAEQLSPPMECTMRNCGGVPAEEIGKCALKHCIPELLLTYRSNPGCVYCLAGTVGQPRDAVADTCGKPPGASSVYGGNNGVVMISRLPLARKQALPLKSTMSNRVALLAQVRPRGAKEPVAVACMHASSRLALPAPTSGYISWNAEKRGQILAAARALSAMAGRGPAILVGDLNTGPQAPTWSPTDPQPFRDAVASGLRVPEPWLAAPFCTACPDSTFRKPAETPRAIDMVLYGETSSWKTMRATRAERFFDRTVAVLGPDGRPVVTHLSDHFGMRVTFELTSP